MSTKILKVFGALAAVVILALALIVFVQPGSVSAAALDRQGGPGGRGGYGQGTGTGVTGSVSTILSAAEKDALNQAVLEEYGALNLYQSVIAQFGNVYPFSQIVRAEQQHVNALIRQATKYGITLPANPGLSTTVPTFNTLSDACQVGAAAEIADAALYDELKPVVMQSSLLQVFNNLQSASLNSHLPAFQTCQ